MFWANQSQGISFWFACASMPLILGLLLIILATQSRTARWLYLRVEQPGHEWPRIIQFGFPLPLGLTAWLLRFLRRRIPNLLDIDLDEMLSSLGRSATPENPFYVQVEDDEDGEKVEIYIG
jgi:TRAP-type C4-dicarboxylate transport system permease small subunit